MLAAALILAIMVTPYITAVSRDILRAIPRARRGKARMRLARHGGKQSQHVVLPYARGGIVGAVIFGLGSRSG